MTSPRVASGLGFASLVSLCGILACAPPEEVGTPEVARPVKFLRVAQADDGSPFEYPGRLAPARQADMAFEISGRIVTFPVAEGQRVTEGQVLASLDVRDVQAAFDAEAARQRAAQAEYDRMKSLFDQGIASRRDLDHATSNLTVLNAAVRTARKRVEDAVLRAPFGGRVARKLVEDFSQVQAKQVVLILQDDSWLEVKLDIPEADLRFANGGTTPEERVQRLRPEVEITSFPERRFSGRITEVATTADPNTRTFSATVAFAPPTDIVVLPGMTAKVTVRLRPPVEGEVLVPAHAVLAGADGLPFVWKLDPETMRVRRADVTVGEMTGAHIAITAGLAAGDEVAISGAARLREGTPVHRFAERP